MNARPSPIILWLLLLSFTAFTSAEENAKDSADRHFMSAEKQMDAIAQQVKTRLRGRDLASFEAAQKAWKTFRGADCSLRASFSAGGGSAYTTDYMDNLIEMTKNRTEQLRKLLDLVKDNPKTEN